MIEFVATITIGVTQDEVFRFVANRENYPRWIGAVSGERIAILSQEPFGEGTLIREGHGVMRVFNVQVNRSFELELIRLDFLGRTLLKKGHTLFQFKPDENGCYRYKKRFKRYNTS